MLSTLGNIFSLFKIFFKLWLTVILKTWFMNLWIIFPKAYYQYICMLSSFFDYKISYNWGRNWVRKNNSKFEMSNRLCACVHIHTDTYKYTHIYNIPWRREREWGNLTVYFITVSLKKWTKVWEGTLFKIYTIRSVPGNNLSRRKHKKIMKYP